MTRLVLTAVLTAACGLAAGRAADDLPAKKLNAVERLEAISKWRRLVKSGFEAHAAGKYHEAETYLTQSLDISRRVFPGDHPNVATDLNLLARTLHHRGRLIDAERYSREALAMWRRLPEREYLAVAASLSNLAGVLEDRGQSAEAELLLREAVGTIQRFQMGDDPVLSGLLNNQATILNELGRPVEAERLIRSALAMDRRLHRNKDHPAVATDLNNLASVLHQTGNPAEAERLYREALAMNRRLHGDHHKVASGLHNVAAALYDLGRPAEAEQLYRDCLAMWQVLQMSGHPSAAGSQSNLATVVEDLGRPGEALQLRRDALATWRRRGSDREVVTGVTNLANTLRLQGRTAEAIPLFREAMNLNRSRIAGYAALGEIGNALSLAESLPLVRDAFLCAGRENRLDPVRMYSEVWVTKANISRIIEHVSIAARAVSGSPEAARLLATLVDARRRRAELIHVAAFKDVATQKKHDDDLKALTDRVTDLDRQLRPLLPAIDRVDKLATATPIDLRKALPPDAAVLDFLRYIRFDQDPAKPGPAGETRTPTYAAFVVTKEKVAWVDLGPAEPIEAAVDAWRRAITGGPDGKTPPAPLADERKLAAEVRRLVWDKVRKELSNGIQTVYVSPDLALTKLPWAALPGDKPDSILLDDFAVATIPHAAFLLDKLWPQDPVKNPPTQTLVVGGVAYDADPPGLWARMALAAGSRSGPLLAEGKSPRWLPLPGAAAEANGVAAAARAKGRPPRPLTAAAATPAAVLAELPRARHAHFATHGFFADPSFRGVFQIDPKLFEMRAGERVGAAAQSPLVMTGLVFAGANRPETPGRGIVTGEALVDLDLSGLELAVLSACETGLGDVAGGEGTFGLQRAFHLAGTRDVVASLWKVPDQSTAALMAEFYRNLWDKGLSPIEALRQAQRHLYKNPGKIPELAAGFRGKFEEVPGTPAPPPAPPGGVAHPRLWAAFVLSGPGR